LAHQLQFRVLPEHLAVCKLGSDDRIPDWTMQGVFFCVIRARDEVSVVCPEDLVPHRVPAERGWATLKLEGPFPFDLTGVLAAFLDPLAEAKVPIFAISTFNTDYVLVKRENIARAVEALLAAGHEKIS
jgi:hypothetical protein